MGHRIQTYVAALIALSACTAASRPQPSTAAQVSEPPVVVEQVAEPTAEPLAPAASQEPVALISPPSDSESDTLPAFSREEQERIAVVQRYVRTAAKKHQVDPNLINGVIWVESRFQTRARGKQGPRGLMQLMPGTGRALARQLGRRYLPYSADFNIDAGTAYLAHMFAVYDGDAELALAAYTAGPGTVHNARVAGEALSDRVQNYVHQVLRAARVFEERGVH